MAQWGGGVNPLPVHVPLTRCAGPGIKPAPLQFDLWFITLWHHGHEVQNIFARHPLGTCQDLLVPELKQGCPATGVFTARCTHTPRDMSAWAPGAAEPWNWQDPTAYISSQLRSQWRPGGSRKSGLLGGFTPWPSADTCQSFFSEGPLVQARQDITDGRSWFERSRQCHWGWYYLFIHSRSINTWEWFFLPQNFAAGKVDTRHLIQSHECISQTHNHTF